MNMNMNIFKLPNKKQFAIELLLSLMCAFGIFVVIKYSEFIGVAISMITILAGVLLWYFNVFNRTK